MISVTLPLPPSVNGAYTYRGRKRVKTAPHRDWKSAAGWEIQIAKPVRCDASRIDVEIRVPENMLGDADNRIKLTLDLLVLHRLIPDDRFVWALTVRRSVAVPTGKMIVSYGAHAPQPERT